MTEPSWELVTTGAHAGYVAAPADRVIRTLLSPGGVALLATADLWEMLRARGPVMA